VTRKLSTFAAVAVLTLGAVAVYAGWTFDASLGTGFVGKGDVQLALGLNNAQVQNTIVNFTYSSSSSTTWTCTKTWVTGSESHETEHVVVQNRHNTTSVSGVVSSVARVRNQITGYNLMGFSGSPSVTESGQAVGTCPADPSGFVFDEDSVETQTTGGGLSVNGVPLDPLARY
jgi:hypothetical protein